MRKSKFLLLVSFFVVVAVLAPLHPAHAALFSGAYLMELCARDDDGKEIVQTGHTACQSYIAGVIDYHKLLQSMGTSPSVDLCVPENISMNDLQDIVWQYLNEHQENDGFIAAPSVSIALYEVFPCDDG